MPTQSHLIYYQLSSPTIFGIPVNTSIISFSMFAVLTILWQVKVALEEPFKRSNWSEKRIIRLLLFLCPYFLLVKHLLSFTLYTYFFIYYLLYTSVCTFTHTPQHTSSVLRIFHMICIFLCTICIFTSITTTIPNLTSYYHSYTY